MEREDGVYYLPWQQGGGSVPYDCIPYWEEQREILKQRTRLPHALCHKGNVDATIAELEKSTCLHFAEWRYAPLLRGELVLLLDETLKARLNGYSIAYSKENGLSCEKGA